MSEQGCGACGHRDRHRPPPRQRPDDPAHCERCPACAQLRAELGVPTSFRLVHLLLLEEVARRGPVVALQDLSVPLAVRLQQAGLLDAAPAARWSDVVWMAHDLEDWALTDLHRVPSVVLGATDGAHPVAAGISLSPTGEALLRRTRSAQGVLPSLGAQPGRPRPAQPQENP